MPEIISQPLNNPTLTYDLDPFGRQTLENLAKWAKFVGIMNIITGILYALSIFAFAIPIAVIGIFTIIMGTKLNSAGDYLRIALYNGDSPSLYLALDQIRSYMTINGILQIIMISIVLLVIILFAIFGYALSDFINEGEFEYSLRSIIGKI